jgi:hypothetical protein
LAFRWHQIALFTTVLPVLSFILWFWASESPIFLLRCEDGDAAAQTLKKLYGKDFDTDQEICRIRTGLEWTAEQAPDKNALEKLFNILKRPDLYKPFGILMLMYFIQQFSGIAIIKSYVVVIFNEIFTDESKLRENMHVVANDTDVDPFHPLAGVKDYEDLDYEPEVICDPDSGEKTAPEAYIAAIMIAAIRFFSSALLSRLLLNYGRRKLYFMSGKITGWGRPPGPGS